MKTVLLKAKEIGEVKAKHIFSGPRKFAGSPTCLPLTNERGKVCIVFAKKNRF